VTEKRSQNAVAAAVYLPIADLKPNPKNPRVHGRELAALARTILRTTWGDPMVAQSRGRRIISGHGRLEAAKLIMGGIEVDGELRGGPDHYFDKSAPGPGMVPVRLVDVDDATADAMTLSANARAIQGEDSAELVAEMAAQFGRDAAVMADIGFDGAALDALIKGAGDAILGGALPPRSDGPPTDPNAEWSGMPEFEQKDKTAFRSLALHFNDQAAVDEFAALIGQKITPQTRFVWFPEIVIERYADKAYVDDDQPAAP